MATRSKLDEIEDMNFAVTQIIHKGKSIEELTILLNKRGATREQTKTIIDTILKTYAGVRRIESSKLIRVINCTIDLIIVFIPILLFILMYSKNTNSNYFESLFPFVFFLYPFLYYFLFESIMGQTVGKLITGTIVVDENGKLPNIGKILVRTICRLIPFDNLSLIIGDRILHDKIPNTYIVNKKRWGELYKQEK